MHAQELLIHYERDVIQEGRYAAVRLTYRLRSGCEAAIAGKAVMDGSPLEKGAKVTVIGGGDALTFEGGPEDKGVLAAAIREANRGEVLIAWSLEK